MNPSCRAVAAALAVGCAFAAHAVEPRTPPTPAGESKAPRVPQADPAIALEREIRASGLDTLARSMLDEESVGLVFGMFRAVLDGKEAAVPAALERKLDRLAEELPKKLAPLMQTMLDAAEAELRRAMREARTAPPQAAPR